MTKSGEKVVFRITDNTYYSSVLQWLIQFKITERKSALI